MQEPAPYSRLAFAHGLDGLVEVVTELLPDGDAEAPLELVSVVYL